MAGRGRQPKRRDDGEGSVYQLKDGRWQAAVTVGWIEREDGSRRRRCRYASAPTKAEAKAKLKALLDARAGGRLPVGESVTVESWIRYWFEHIAPRRCSERTLEGYATMINHWIVPTIGKVRLADLEPEHIEALHDAMFTGKARKRSNGRTVAAKPLAGTSVLLAHRVLSRALTVAVQRRKIPSNPAVLVDKPRPRDVTLRPDQYLSEADARKVLATCDGTWDDARWSVGLALGPRPGERLGPLWSDFDLANGIWTLQRQLQRRRAKDGKPGKLVLVNYTKGKKDYREIPIPAPLLAKLREHRRRQIERRIALGDEWIGSPLGELVFTDPYGRALDPRRDWESWRALLKAAGVPYVNPHGSRHTAATLMLTQRVPVRVVQEILGHAPGSAITAKIYQHVTRQLASEATEAVSASLWGDRARTDLPRRSAT